MKNRFGIVLLLPLGLLSISTARADSAVAGAIVGAFVGSTLVASQNVHRGAYCAPPVQVVYAPAPVYVAPPIVYAPQPVYYRTSLAPLSTGVVRAVNNVVTNAIVGTVQAGSMVTGAIVGGVLGVIDGAVGAVAFSRNGYRRAYYAPPPVRGFVRPPVYVAPPITYVPAPGYFRASY
jgi:hypothetical protein